MMQKFLVGLMILGWLSVMGQSSSIATITPPGNKDSAVIVVLKDEPLIKRRMAQGKNMSPEDLKAAWQLWDRELQQQQAEVLASVKTKSNVRVKQFRYLVNAVAMTVPAGELKSLREHPRVAGVYPDTEAVGHLDTSIVTIEADQAWQRTDPQDRPLRGTDIVIAVLDSGVDYNHPDLGGGFGPQFKVIGGHDFIDNDADPMDENGHGTHVAGIVAANGQVRGVAPGSKLLAYRVLDANLVSTESTVIQGLERAADPDGDPTTNDAPHIINMSLGTGGDSLSPLAAAANNVVDSGILVVASAGNLGSIYAAVRAPGAAEKVFTVGATGITGSVATFSSRGPALPYVLKPNVLAPGQSINSTWLNGGYAVQTGTSMSSPHVAGAAALLMQAHPEWDQERIRRRLSQATQARSADPFSQGSGEIRIASTLDAQIEISIMDLNMGRVDLSELIWTRDIEIELHNPTDTARTFQIVESSAGVIQAGFIILDDIVTVQPGETTTVAMRMLVSNQGPLDFPINENLSYSGLIGVLSEDTGYIIPFTLRKSVLLTLQFPEPSAFTFKLDSEFQRLERASPPTSTLEIHAWPAIYTMLGAGTQEAGEQIWFFGEEDLILFADATFEIDPALSDIQPRLTITDLDGNSVPAAQIQEGNTGYTLTNLTTGKAFSLVGNRPFDPLLPPLGDNFMFEVIGMAPVAGKDNTWSEFGYILDGSNQNTNPSYDMRNNRRATYQYNRVSNFDEELSLELSASNFNRLATGTVPPNLTNNLRFRAPAQWTFYFKPQGDIDPITNPFTQIFRRLEVVSTFGGLRSVNAQTPMFRVRDQQEIIYSQINILNLTWTDLETTDSELFRLDNSFLIPGLQWRNTSISLGYTVNDFGHMFIDAWGNQSPPPNMSWRFEEPGDNVTESDLWQELAFFSSIRALAQDKHVLTMDYESLFESQVVAGRFINEFDLDRSDDEPPYVNNVHIVQNDTWTDRVRGSSPASLVLDLNDSEESVETVSLEINPGTGWTNLATTPTGDDDFTAALPDMPPGSLVGMRFTATDPGNNFTTVELETAFRVGYTHVIPWVVNNQQWESRISITNATGTAMDAVLSAVNTAGETRETTVSIPANGVYSATSGQLFADFTGYALRISAIDEGLFPSFLTFNKEEQSGGNSPSQTTARGVDELTPRLMFPYLPGDQIPAIVLCAPDRGQTESDYSTQTTVNLALYDQNGQLAGSREVLLAGNQPSALLVQDLFDQLPEAGAVVALAQNGTKIAGTTFIFNQQREPSMAAGLSRIHEDTDTQMIPWVVNNSQWLSQIAVYNQSGLRGDLHFAAVTTDGQRQEAQVPVEINEVAVVTAEELFPGLSGYSLTINMTTSASTGGDIYASFLTFNREESSGGNSPSQTTGTAPRETSEALLFGYVPTDQIPALVLNAPGGSGQTEVTLTAYGPDGSSLATATVNLQDDQPLAALVSSLFEGITLPVDVAVTAESTVPLAGTTFVFNNQREPSMTKPFPLNQ